MKKVKLYNNRNWLQKRYVEDEKTILEIAREAGVDEITIRRALERFNLK